MCIYWLSVSVSVKGRWLKNFSTSTTSPLLFRAALHIHFVLLLLTLLPLLLLLDDLDVIWRGGGQAVRLLLFAKFFVLVLLLNDLLPNLVVLCQVLHDAAEQPAMTFRPSYKWVTETNILKEIHAGVKNWKESPTAKMNKHKTKWIKCQTLVSVMTLDSYGMTRTEHQVALLKYMVTIITRSPPIFLANQKKACRPLSSWIS